MTTLEPSVARSSLQDHPRFPLRLGPSPVERLERLSKPLGGQPAPNGYAALFR